MKNRGPKSHKLARKERADERQAARNRRTPAQQLHILDARKATAARERRRLERLAKARENQ